MNFGSIKQIKDAVLRRYQVVVPMMLVSSLLLVGYAALDKEAPVVSTDVVTVNYGEELDYGKIQIEDNQTSKEDLKIEYDTTNLDTTKVGASYLTVQVEDMANNITSKIVEVLVVDTEKPVYDLVSDANSFMENGVLVINLNGSNDITDYIVANDNADGDLSAYITTSAQLDTSVASRQAIALSVTDNSGNVNEKTFDIEVRDIETPVLTYKYAEAIEVPYGCDFDLSNYIEVSDNSGDIQTFDPTEPIDTTRDTYTYTIVARDGSGNAISVPLTVVTKDIMGPTITVDSSYEITVGDQFDIKSKTTVKDDKDGEVEATYEGSVDTSKAGTYTITIKATDSAGNTSTKKVTVTVKAKKTTSSSNSKSTSKTTSKTTTVVAANSSASSIVAVAKSKVGCAYQYGATGPNAFDCSGFAQWVYKQCGKSIPRTTYSQYASGTKISYSQIQPGDLIFFNCHNSPCSHVAIYVGNGTIVHAATASTGVCYTTVSNMLCSASIYGCVRY